jgi:hypothetical protein
MCGISRFGIVRRKFLDASPLDRKLIPEKRLAFFASIGKCFRGRELGEGYCLFRESPDQVWLVDRALQTLTRGRQ